MFHLVNITVLFRKKDIKKIEIKNTWSFWVVKLFDKE